MLHLIPLNNDTAYFEGIIKYEIKTTSFRESGEIKENFDTITYYISRNRIKIITNRKWKIRDQEISYSVYDYLSRRFDTYLTGSHTVFSTKMSEPIKSHEIQGKDDSMQVMGFLCKKFDVQTKSTRSDNHIQSDNNIQASIWVTKDLKFQLPFGYYDELFSNTTGYIALYCESENNNHTESNVSGYKKNFHLKSTTRAIEIITKKLPDSEFTYPPNVKVIGN